MTLIKKIICLMISLLACIAADAQFYVTGDDPGKLRWYSINTDNYKVIYPEGNDSLARVYGANLEKFRIPVSRSSGYLPSGGNGKRMPVVLHTWNTSNGSVAWAPKRMDLFTLPSAYNPEPLPWEEMLTIHESRHVAQMQFGMTKALKPGNWILGEMYNIAVSLLFPGITTMEGDAVITETAYSRSGRGRTSDFLNYYRVAFDNGLHRKWVQWRFPSQKNFCPGYYELGYLTVSGLRHFHNHPQYMSEAYHLLAQKPSKILTFRKTAREISGKKSYEGMFQEIADSMAVIWKKEADSRAPYIPMEAVTKEPRLYTDYTSNIFIGDQLYSIKRGHLDAPSLIRLEGDREKRVSAFAATTSKVKVHGNRIYWSENLPDERWSMQTRAKIRFMTGSLVDGNHVWSADKGLSDEERLLYNPSVSPDGKRLACVEYMVKGGSSLVLTDSSDGRVKAVYKAPDGIQLVETAWIEGNIYVTGITHDGYGIYTVTDEGLWSCVLEPQPVMIKDFASYGKELMFTCDRTGVNELYHFNPHEGTLRQKTSIRHGGESFVYSPDGQWLYFSSQTVKGKQIFRTPVSELTDKEADFAQRHEYLLAESLTRQEERLASKEKPGNRDEGKQTDFSEPERYRKFANMFNVHSWTPVYVNVNNIMNMSYDYVYDLASLGATGIIQNRLSTATGEFGYSAHKNPNHPSQWKHSGHARFSYTGLYPAFEVSLDFNDRDAIQYQPEATVSGSLGLMSIKAKEISSPFIRGKLRTYIPFNFSSGGWYRGMIPQFSYTVTNDFFNSSMPYLSTDSIDGSGNFTEEGPGGLYEEVFIGATDGKNRPMQYLSGSIRAYTMLGTSNSAVYPRWGIGFEFGASSIASAREFYSPMGFAYLYGYIPGILRSHGIRLSAMMQTKLSDAPLSQQVLDIMPRGFKGTPRLGSSLSSQKDNMAKISADYAIPVFIGDIGIIDSLFFIKRLVVTPHFDMCMMNSLKENIWSAGCSLTLGLESVFFIGWPCSAGISASYNGGSSFAKIRENYGAGRFHIGPVFSVSF